MTGGSSSGGSGNGWVEGGVAIERSIMDGCSPIACMLEVPPKLRLSSVLRKLREIHSPAQTQGLMGVVYREIYKVSAAFPKATQNALSGSPLGSSIIAG